jgi:hypothetical protein
MRPGYKGLGDSLATAYAVKMDSGTLGFKAAIDPNPRFLADGPNRAITLGSGIDASAKQIHWGSGTPEGVKTAGAGSLYFNYGTGFGLYRKASGSGNTGWQALGYEPFAFASRPNASAAGVGGTYFDTTIKKPCWSDGTNWRDCNGCLIGSSTAFHLNQPQPTDRVDITVLNDNFDAIETRLNTLAG